jgi:glutaredoxin-like protein NrdH
VIILAEEVKEYDEIIFYGLSTCMWCRKTRALLDEKNIEYKGIYVNELDGEEKNRVSEEVKKLNPNRSYPTIKIGDRVVVGYHPEEIEEALAACHPKMRSMSA